MQTSIGYFRYQRTMAIKNLNDSEKRHALVTLIDAAALSYERAEFLWAYMDDRNGLHPEIVRARSEEHIQHLFGMSKDDVPEFLESTYLPMGKYSIIDKQSALNREFGRASCYLGLAKHLYKSLQSPSAAILHDLEDVRERALDERLMNREGILDYGNRANTAAASTRALLEKVENALRLKHNGGGLELSLDQREIYEAITHAANGAEDMPFTHLSPEMERELLGTASMIPSIARRVMEETYPDSYARGGRAA